MNKLFVSLFLATFAHVAKAACGTSPSINPPCWSGNPVASSYSNLPNCPSHDTTAAYNTEYDDCISTSEFYTCYWEAQAATVNTYWVLNLNYAWANQADLCNQVECEQYALWNDCLRSTYRDGHCTNDFSLCFAESCKPVLTFGDRLQGAECTADAECQSGRCSGVCSPPSFWSSTTCYNSKLEPSDPDQWAGCTAADSEASYTAALPSMTWRELRDNVDAQKALCDEFGYMDTTQYNQPRTCPTAPLTPDVLQYTQPVCKFSPTINSDMVEAEVAEEFFDLICDHAERLIKTATEYEIAVDNVTQDACYAQRDQMNNLGIPLGQKCYASCDPDSSATLALSALLAALLF